MKTPNLDVDPFVEALRGDLPNRGDEERVRARLLAAGILVTGAAATTSNAAASLGGNGLGMGSGGAASPLAATASPVAAGAGAGTLATTPGVGVSASSGALSSGALSSGALSSAAASGAAAGVAGGLGATGAPAALAKAGLLSKVLLLPMAAKLGVATTLAVAVASSVPLVVSQGDPAPSHDTTSPAPQARVAKPTLDAPGGASPPRASVPSGDSPVSPRNDALQASGGVTSGSVASGSVASGSVTSGSVTSGSVASGSARAPSPKATATKRRESIASAPERGRTEKVRASTLGEETRLMEQAMLALGEEDRDLAQRSLDEHARRFPRGLLVPERERAREHLRQLDADGH
jgi:hypothetical protein